MLKIGELCVNLHPNCDMNTSMKQIKDFCMLLAGMIIIASCSSSENSQATLYSEASITAFSLVKMNRYVEQVDDEGNVKTVKSSYTASGYKFVIDQIKREIYNPDSLPAGTDAAHALCSVSTYRNSTALFKDEKEEDTYYIYTSTDSVDLSKPRTIRVLSSDGNGYSDYTLKVNVHQQNANDFEWKKTDDFGELQYANAIKAFYYDSDFYLFCDLDGKTQIFYSEDGNNWTRKSTTFSSEACNNVAKTLTGLYVLDNGVIYESTTGDNWDPITDYLTEEPLKQLIGASSFEIYALSESNHILFSMDLGRTWLSEVYDDVEHLLPTEDIAMVCTPVNMADDTEQILMVGNRAASQFPDDKYAVLWRKIVDYGWDAPWAVWNYMDRGGKEEYNMPRYTNINLLPYEDGIIVFGMPDSNSKEEPYSTILQSRDSGITWKKNNAYYMPSFDQTPTLVASVVDENDYIWLFCAGANSGEIWKGRLNRVSWIYQE